MLLLSLGCKMSHILLFHAYICLKSADRSCPDESTVCSCCLAVMMLHNRRCTLRIQQFTNKPAFFTYCELKYDLLLLVSK